MTWKDMPKTYKILAIVTLAFMLLDVILAVISPIVYAKASEKAGIMLLNIMYKILLPLTSLLIIITFVYAIYLRGKKHK